MFDLLSHFKMWFTIMMALLYLNLNILYFISDFTLKKKKLTVFVRVAKCLQNTQWFAVGILYIILLLVNTDYETITMQKRTLFGSHSLWLL